MTITREQTAATPAGVAPAARIIDGVKVYGQGATAVRALDIDVFVKLALGVSASGVPGRASPSAGDARMSGGQI